MSADMFVGVVVLLVEAGIGKVQIDVLRKHITSKGGKLSTSIVANTTHIITKLDYFKLLKHMKWTELQVKPTLRIHSLEWVTESLKRGERVGDHEFVVEAPRSPRKELGNNRKPADTVTIKSALRQSNPPPQITNIVTNKQPSTTTVNTSRRFDSDSDNDDNSKTSSSKRRRLNMNDSSYGRDDSHSDISHNSDISRSDTSRVTFSTDDSYESRDGDGDGDTHDGSRDDSDNSRGDIRDHSGDNGDTTVKSDINCSWLSYASSDEGDHANCSTLSDTTIIMSPMVEKKRSHKPKSTQSGNGHDDSYDSPSIPRSTRRTSDDVSSPRSGYFPPPPLSPIGLHSQDGYDSPTDEGTSAPKKLVKEKPKIDKRTFFVCQNNTTVASDQNKNKEITDILQRLEDTAESTGDKWRAYAYRKAINILKRLTYKVVTFEQIKNVRGIGNRIAEKIGEIIETGKLRKAEIRDPMTETLKIFSNVFGAGPETVKKWYAQGYRTLQDLQKATTLNHQQVIGVKYYQEFLQRIPRDEVASIEAKVLRIALELDPNIQLTTCGSYRRGKADCGDIDILLSQVQPSAGFLNLLVERLQANNIITDHLTSSIVDKYMGVCQVNSRGIHRRIDLRLIPLSEWPCALLYFTGSDHFNRSMRLWARKHGYSLNEHALVQRWGRLNRYEVKGEPLTVSTENDVFRILGLEFREPKDREV